MDQFVLIEQDDNNLYIKILSSRYIAPYDLCQDDQQQYTLTISNKKYFGCLTADCQPFAQSTIYPYIGTITFQYYEYINQPITNKQALEIIRKKADTEQIERQVNQIIEQKINQVVDLEQLRQFKQLQEKVDLLQQRVMDITRKVKKYIRL